MQRRFLIRAAGAAAATTAWFGVARAQSGPLSIIVEFPPGGGTDTSTRVIAKKLQDVLGVPVLVDNKPGGNTIIGTEALVRAAPDGRTIGMLLNNHTVNQTLYKGRLNYDLHKDLAPISLTHGNAHVLLVYPKFPANTFTEFVEYVKAHPGKVTFCSAGSGSVNHLAGEMLKKMAGLDMVHIPYKGIGTLMPDLLAGRVDVLFGAMPIGLELVAAKRIRMLAVTTPKRQPETPDLPAIAEFYPGYGISSWFGYAAPGGTPPATINKLNAALVKVMKDPDTAARLPAFQMFGSTPQEFADFLREDEKKAAELIAGAGVKID